jgi:DNA-binding response OmpR family regulator
MLFEDDANMLSLLETLLQIEGYSVSTVKDTNLDNIMAALHREKPSLALIDVHLRALNGFDLLESIRTDSELKDMRVLMSSGLDLSTECIKKGANDFILKPFMPDELIYKIQRSLQA